MNAGRVTQAYIQAGGQEVYVIHAGCITDIIYNALYKTRAFLCASYLIFLLAILIAH